MFALLGGVLGLFTSFFPELMKIFKQKQDQKHELAMMELQMKAQSQAHTERLEEINTNADIQESLALYKSSEVKYTGVKWMDAILEFLNGSVRPIVTYLFVFFYIFIKIAQYHGMAVQDIAWEKAALLLWAEFDQACLMMVLGFWFGQRMASKVFKLGK